MDRRQFLNWVGLGALATSLPVAIAACQSESSPSTSSSTESSEASGASEVGSVRSDGSFVIGTVADLDENGTLRGRPSFASSAVLVVRSPEDADVLQAVDTICPHQACSVEWDVSASEFACPCHGSTFAADGSVTNGPATDPLATFGTTIDADVVLVKPA